MRLLGLVYISTLGLIFYGIYLAIIATFDVKTRENIYIQRNETLKKIIKKIKINETLKIFSIRN